MLVRRGPQFLQAPSRSTTVGESGMIDLHDLRGYPVSFNSVIHSAVISRLRPTITPAVRVAPSQALVAHWEHEVS